LFKLFFFLKKSLFIVVLVFFLKFNSIGNVFANNNLKVFSYADIVEKVIPAVVSIQTIQEVPLSSHPLFNDPLFKFFYGDSDDEFKGLKKHKHLLQGLGSGVIVDELGHILTNNHVVKNSNSIIIKMSNGISSPADVIGVDVRTDLAVLKIRKKELYKSLSIMSLGDSDKIRVGDIVLAIGNPFGFDNTVTQGIISGLGSISARSNEQQISLGGWLDNLIQTDAAINPGNSGGALIDSDGKLIGINIAIVSRSGGYQGIGFAIPINLAKDIMNKLIKHGRIIRGWLGVQLSEIDEEHKQALGFKELSGVYIQGTIKNSPAQKSGLLPGDILVKINNVSITSVHDAIRLVGLLSPNKKYNIEIFRNFKYMSLYVIIGQTSD
jgi:serine protease DegS